MYNLAERLNFKQLEDCFLLTFLESTPFWNEMNSVEILLFLDLVFPRCGTFHLSMFVANAYTTSSLKGHIDNLSWVFFYFKSFQSLQCYTAILMFYENLYADTEFTIYLLLKFIL